MAYNGKISKAEGYKNRIYTIEYDLVGMMNAYGPRHVVELIGMIQRGEITTSMEAQRWAAHNALNEPVVVYAIEKAPKETKRKSRRAA